MKEIFEFQVPRKYQISAIECLGGTKADLLADQQSKPRTRNSDNSVEMNSYANAMELLREAVKRRTKGDNGIHRDSSRSHLFLYVSAKGNGNAQNLLTIIDLGGSEHIGEKHQANGKSFLFYFTSMYF